MTSQGKAFLCKCYLYRNYFLPCLRLHVTYHNQEQFLKDYGQELKQKGIHTEEDIDSVVAQLETEKKRRQENTKTSNWRRSIIAEKYTPLHPSIYKLQEKFLDSSFMELVSYCKSPGANTDGVLERVIKSKAEKVFSFPVFTHDFCKAFMEELDHFEQSDMPRGRPNTMNKFGILLYELGMDEQFITPLRKNYLAPITSVLYPEWGGASLDSHRAFTVTYDIDHDIDLSYHYDNAEITINVSLSSDFEEGSLYFVKMKQIPAGGLDITGNLITEYIHRPCWGVMHRGQHIHGALPITDGKRVNLIIWMRSSAIRNYLCPMCNDTPQLQETEGQGDGFTQASVDVCSVN